MHEENILENTPNNTPCLVLVSFLKVEISPLENQYFSTFQIPLEPCCQRGSMVLTVFETLKSIDFH